MNWYGRVKTSAQLKMAEPHFISACPQCNADVVCDLFWERRAGDPTLKAFGMNGQVVPTPVALKDSQLISHWASNEKITCPQCRVTWFSEMTKRIQPVLDFSPRERIISVGTPPSGVGDFHEAEIAA